MSLGYLGAGPLAPPIVLERPLPWYAVRVKPNFEQTSSMYLEAKGYEYFLPRCRTRRRWSDRIKEVSEPLFPGYLFCRFDPQDRLPVVTTPGVVSIVSFGKSPAAVDPAELAAVRAILNSDLEARPWPFLTCGRRVVVRAGPLRGLRGLVVELKGDFRLVVSVTLLCRSVSAELERHWVDPIE